MCFKFDQNNHDSRISLPMKRKFLDVFFHETHNTRNITIYNNVSFFYDIMV